MSLFFSLRLCGATDHHKYTERMMEKRSKASIELKAYRLIALNYGRLIAIHSKHFNRSFQHEHLLWLTTTQCGLLYCSSIHLNTSATVDEIMEFFSEKRTRENNLFYKFNSEVKIYGLIIFSFTNINFMFETPEFCSIFSFQCMRSHTQCQRASIPMIYVVFVFLPKHNHF